MADGNKIARRSARPFSDEYPRPQAESASASDAGTGYKRGSSDREEKPHEKEMHSRNSSCSSLPTTTDLGMELRGFHGAPHEDAREIIKCLETAKSARDRVEGRPVNFGVVMPGVYRSGYPEAKDHEFMETLHLKTIITLVQKDFPEGYEVFTQLNGIKHIVIDMQGTKKVEISQETMISIMKVVLDQRNYPLLMHCNHGKHRTGCAIAVVRKLMGWPVEAIIEEYSGYAADKVRDNDVNYIRAFDTKILAGLTDTPRFDNGVRATDRRVISNGPKSARMKKITAVTSLVLLLWLLTAFFFRA